MIIGACPQGSGYTRYLLRRTPPQKDIHCYPSRNLVYNEACGMNE